MHSTPQMTAHQDPPEDTGIEDEEGYLNTPGRFPLVNHKWELFVQNMMRGQGVNLAYQNAGYDLSPGNASRLKGRQEVKERLQFLILEAAKDTVIDPHWVRRKLKKLVDLTLATEMQRDGTVKPTATTNFSAANRALELLGKDLSMFKERIELGGQVQVLNTELLRKLTPEERAQMREMLVVAAGRAPMPANQNDEDEATGGVVPALPAK
jgi:hypothetical protein